MSDEQLSGSCLCGKVQYKVQGPWLRFRLCYCSRCRKVTGSAHASNLFAAADKLEWTAGSDDVVRYDLPAAERFGRSFCRHCGSGLPHLLRDGSAWLIPAGSLDQAPSMQAQARIFWASRAPWAQVVEDMPRFDEYPPNRS
jgi:hypothetical protein